MRFHSSLFLVVLFMGAHPAWAIPPDRTMNVDWLSEISRVIDQQERFAVEKPLDVTTDKQGRWSQEGTDIMWTYSLSVPGSLGLGLRGAATLPAGTRLEVEDASGKVSPVASPRVADILWVPTQAGSQITLRARVPQTSRPSLKLHLLAVQAQYINMSSGKAIPEYERAKAAAKSDVTACTLNYMCEKSSSNDGPGRATVMLTISNTYTCSGTLLNNVRGDGRPFVLSARHCFADGDATSAAASLQVYWRYEVACGQDVDTGGPFGDVNHNYHVQYYQTGATHRASNEDAWLVELLDAPPPGAQPYAAGFDATNVQPSHGYGIHHGHGEAKQFVEQRVDAEHTGTTSFYPGGPQVTEHEWQTTILQGEIRKGSSGSALFTDNNHVIGPLAGGALCGNTSTQMAGYNTLGDPWNGDGTPSGALRFWLDPDNSGTKVVDGKELYTTPPPAPTLTLSSDRSTVAAGGSATLTWSSTDAVSCSASGAWSGSRSLSGSQGVNVAAGQQQFVLTCLSADNQSVSKSATITGERDVSSNFTLSSSAFSGAAGSTITLSWSTPDATSCSASNAWSGTKLNSGSEIITLGPAGTYTYALLCSNDISSATRSITLTSTAPANSGGAGGNSGGSNSTSGGAVGFSWLLAALLGAFSKRFGDPPQTFTALAGVRLPSGFVLSQWSDRCDACGRDMGFDEVTPTVSWFGDKRCAIETAHHCPVCRHHQSRYFRLLDDTQGGAHLTYRVGDEWSYVHLRRQVSYEKLTNLMRILRSPNWPRGNR